MYVHLSTKGRNGNQSSYRIQLNDSGTDITETVFSEREVPVQELMLE
jgi:hypothetical protein